MNLPIAKIKRKLNLFFSFFNLKNNIVSRRKNYSIFIYSMGKVGSSTIYDTIKMKYPLLNIFHIHFLNLDVLLKHKNTNFHMNYVNGMKAFKHYQSTKNRRKIITLTREPIKRAVSNLFQNYKKIGYFNNSDLNAKNSLDYLKQENFDFPLNWFSDEFNRFLNIDVYNYKFDYELGYQIINLEDFDILIINLEKLNQNFKVAIKRFLDLDINTLYVSNTSKSKGFKSITEYINMNLSYDSTTLDKILNSKYINHFYIRKEMENYYNSYKKI